jgi:acetyl-CoA acetyltransferase
MVDQLAGRNGDVFIASAAHELRRRDGRYVLATLSLGGGGSVALGVERVAPAA